MKSLLRVRWKHAGLSLLIILSFAVSIFSSLLTTFNSPVSAYTYTNQSVNSSEDCAKAGGIWKTDDQRNSFCQMTSRPDQNATVFAYAGWLADCMKNAYPGITNPRGSGSAPTTVSATDIQNYKMSGGETLIGTIIANDDGKVKCSTPDNVRPKVQALGYSDYLELLKAVGCTAGSNGSYLCNLSGQSAKSIFQKIVNTKYGAGAALLTNVDKYYISLRTFEIGCKANKIASPTSADRNSADNNQNNMYNIKYVETDGTITQAVYKAGEGSGKNINTFPKSIGWDDGNFECGTLANMINTYADAYSTWAKANLAAASASAAAAATATGTTTSGSKNTCGSTVSGIGWIVCPLMNSVAKVNDAIFKSAKLLLNVSPLEQKSGGDTIYAAWGSIRNLANVAFVIVMLVIIFSQITGAGISNYGIKKMLPRLIIGAIAVNLSFIIMQIAVDLANIIGSSLYELIVSMAPEVKANWVDLIQEVVVAAGVTAGITVAVGLSFGSEAFLLLIAPTLIMAFLMWLAAFATLLLRHILIIMAVIISPLAFVAYLLPNTQNWFNKWKDTLLSMLMLYPLAAIIFGGAQFAAAVVEGLGGAWNKFLALVILALPMFSLPFLVRQGGPLLSKIGGTFASWADKARNPLNQEFGERRENAKARFLADENMARNSRNPFTRFSRRLNRAREDNRLSRKAETEERIGEFSRQSAEGEVTGAFNDQVNTYRGRTNREVRASKVATERRNAALSKTINSEVTGSRPDVGNEEYAADHAEQQANFANTERLMRDTGFDATRIATETAKGSSEQAADLANTRTEQDDGVLQVRAQQTATARQLENAQQHTKRVIAELGTSVADTELSRDAQRVANATRGPGGVSEVREDLQRVAVEGRVETEATTAAEDRQKQDIADILVAPGAADPGGVARQAAGIAGEVGAARVQARAQSEQAKFRQDNVVAAATLFTTQGLTLGEDPTATTTDPVTGATRYSGELMRVAVDGTLPDGSTATSEQREAAMQMLVNTGSTKSMIRLHDAVAGMPSGDSETLRLQQAFGRMVGSSPKKPKAIGGFNLSALSSGTQTGTFAESVVFAARMGKVSATSFVGMEKDEITEWAKTIDSALSADPAALVDDKGIDHRADIRTSIEEALTNPDIRKDIPDEKVPDMEALLKTLA